MSGVGISGVTTEQSGVPESLTVDATLEVLGLWKTENLPLLGDEVSSFLGRER